MSGLWLALAYVLGFLAITRGLYQYLTRIKWDDEESRRVVSLAFGLFWPILTPAMGLWLLLYKGLGRLLFHQREETSDE